MSTKKDIALTYLIVLVTLSVLAPPTSARKPITATATSNLCTYTVMVDEFDVSKCPAVSEHAQADGLGPGHMTGDVTSDFRTQTHHHRRNRGSKRFKNNAGYKLDDSNEATMQMKEMESKLIDEMVKSRELNLTLARHEDMLNTAQQTLAVRIQLHILIATFLPLLLFF